MNHDTVELNNLLQQREEIDKKIRAMIGQINNSVGSQPPYPPNQSNVPQPPVVTNPLSRYYRPEIDNSGTKSKPQREIER